MPGTPRHKSETPRKPRPTRRPQTPSRVIHAYDEHPSRAKLLSDATRSKTKICPEDRAIRAPRSPYAPNFALPTLNCTGPGRPFGCSSPDIQLPEVIPRPTLARPGRIGPARNPMSATRRDGKSACHARPIYESDARTTSPRATSERRRETDAVLRRIALRHALGRPRARALEVRQSVARYLEVVQPFAANRHGVANLESASQRGASIPSSRHSPAVS